MAHSKRSTKKVERRKQKLRDEIWPDAPDVIWSYNDSPGWLNIPRSMPIILRIIDSLSKGQPLSNTYLELWCRTYNDGFINASRIGEMAFFSGFDGERAQRTWASRIKKLEELNFIRVAPGASSDFDHMLILNPYKTIISLREAKKIPDRLWNSLVSRMIEIGASDLDEVLLEPEEEKPAEGETNLPKKKIRQRKQA